MSMVPVNVQIPGSAEAPVVADFIEHALRVAYVNRAHLKALPMEDWQTPGVYVLLTGDGSGNVYVGKATNLRRRLQNHDTKPKFDWNRSVVIKRDTTHGFNSAEIGYLEGRLAAELHAVASLNVVEGLQSLDDTLPPHMQLSLDALLTSMLAAVRLAGVDISKEADEPELAETEDASSKQGGAGHPSKRGYTRIKGTVADLVSAGLIRAGEEVHLSQGGVTGRGTISAAGEIIVKGVAYASPSKAAATALGLQSSNGWTTWHVGSFEGPTLDHYRKAWGTQQAGKAT